MGWFSSNLTGHEGYAVGFVVLVKDGRKCDSIYRELGYADEEVQSIAMMSAACECGWRSARWKPERYQNSRGQFCVPDFSPHTVFVGEGDEQRALALWNEHVDQVLGREGGARRAIATARTRVLEVLEDLEQELG